MEAVNRVVSVSAPEGDGIRAKKILTDLGYAMGYRLCERFSAKISSFDSVMDVFKFLCKDLWTVLFCKPVDKLQTNKQGLYVIHDAQFRWFKALSPLIDAEAGADHESLLTIRGFYLAFACGAVKGALANLGLSVSCQAEAKGAACKFVPTQVADLL
jgi:hypothetical protein